jgi:hypothetical protein
MPTSQSTGSPGTRSGRTPRKGSGPQRLRAPSFGESASTRTWLERPVAAQPRTQREAAEPRRPAAHPACDFCRGALRREERHRLVWESPSSELVLADLCSGCATSAETLLELYGCRGRESIALVQEVRPSARPHRVVGFVARGALYLLIALTFFLIVTLISSRAR